MFAFSHGGNWNQQEGCVYLMWIAALSQKKNDPGHRKIIQVKLFQGISKIDPGDRNFYPLDQFYQKKLIDPPSQIFPWIDFTRKN